MYNDQFTLNTIFFMCPHDSSAFGLVNKKTKKEVLKMTFRYRQKVRPPICVMCRLI